jgi:hypothetical protein
MPTINSRSVDNLGAGSVDCTPALNTAVALTIASEQSGVPTLCKSTQWTPSYTCTLNAVEALTTYTPGMRIFLWPDVTCLATCNLKIDGVGTGLGPNISSARMGRRIRVGCW